jgi:hypothetical protein
MNRNRCQSHLYAKEGRMIAVALIVVHDSSNYLSKGHRLLSVVKKIIPRFRSLRLQINSQESGDVPIRDQT